MSNLFRISSRRRHEVHGLSAYNPHYSSDSIQNNERDAVLDLQSVMSVSDVARHILSFLYVTTGSQQELVHRGFVPLTARSNSSISKGTRWQAIKVLPSCSSWWLSQSKQWFTHIGIELYITQEIKPIVSVSRLRIATNKSRSLSSATAQVICQEVLKRLLHRIRDSVTVLRFTGIQNNTSNEEIVIELPSIPWKLVASCPNLHQVVVAGMLTRKDQVVMFQNQDFTPQIGHNEANVPIQQSGICPIRTTQLVGICVRELRDFLVRSDVTLQHIGLIAPVQINLDDLITVFRAQTHIQSLSLDLFGQGAVKLPREIRHMLKLREIHWSNAGLVDVPNELFKMTTVQVLLLPKNRISLKSFQGICMMMNLTKLDLSQNNLKEIPSTIGNLTNLQELNLSFNGISDIPSSIQNLQSLQVLELDRNRLRQVPASVCQLQSILELHMSSNRIAILSKEICKMRHIRVLKLQRNGLLFLPDSLGTCATLEVLVLSDNLLSRLPETLHGLESITDLRINSNHLTELPDSMAELKTLIALDIADNNISKLPDGLTELPKLERFQVGGNRLESM